VADDADADRRGSGAASEGIVSSSGEGVRAEGGVAVGDTVRRSCIRTHQRAIEIKTGVGDHTGGGRIDRKISPLNNALAVGRRGEADGCSSGHTPAGGAS